MKSNTVLQCEQCTNEGGSFVASELDITNCRKIENIRGRLVCSERDSTPTVNDDAGGNNKDETAPTTNDNVKDLEDNNKQPTKTDDEFDEEPTDGLPRGSYRRDCTGCQLKLKHDKTFLACDSCKRKNGVSQYSISYVSLCMYFVNQDGVLRCDYERSQKF